eukprot:6237369-Pyramimonas_sp.AAC.1
MAAVVACLHIDSRRSGYGLRNAATYAATAQARYKVQALAAAATAVLLAWRLHPVRSRGSSGTLGHPDAETCATRSGMTWRQTHSPSWSSTRGIQASGGPRAPWNSSASAAS